MIEHIVMLRFRDDVDPAQIDALAQAFAALPAKIPQIRDFAFGANAETARNSGYTHVLVSRFESADDLQAYAVHPDHVAVVEQRIKPILAASAVADLDRG